SIRQVLTDFVATHSDIKIDIQRIIIEGNQAVVEWNWEEIESATGRRTRANDAIVVDFQGNQIRRWREYIDTETPKNP
ncbi:MAG: nuclear transport factor 2 family protein, partial [Microcystaceae cyanobacterium]